MYVIIQDFQVPPKKRMMPYGEGVPPGGGGGVPPAQRETRSCVTERATSLKGDIYSSTSVRGACQLKNPVWKTELSDGRLSLMLSCNCLSCLPGECRPPDGWTAHTLPCPEGQGYLNFRPSGELRLSVKFLACIPINMKKSIV